MASPASAAPPSLGVETLTIDDSLVNSVLLVAAAWSPSSCSLFKKGALSFGGCVSDVMENAGGGPPTVAEITTEMPTLASGGLALLAGQVLCVPMRGGRLRDPWRGVGCAVLTLDKSLAVVVLHEVDEENDMGAERLHVAFGLGDRDGRCVVLLLVGARFGVRATHGRSGYPILSTRRGGKKCDAHGPSTR